MFNKIHVLFVCSANVFRSRTAEIFFQNKYRDINIRSAGIDSRYTRIHNSVRLERRMVEVFDYVYCMEEEHKTYISQWFKPVPSKVKVLGIEDVYNFMEGSLIHTLNEKLKNEPWYI